MGDVRSTFEEIESTLKRSAAALRDTGLRFALAGSVACWARGAPQSRNDLDFLVTPEDAERALQALCDAGMRPERPPEGWLLKAWDPIEDGEVLVDIIFGPRGIADIGAVLDRAEIVAVAALDVPVVHLDDVMVMKLHAFDEHACDYNSILAIARAVREQVDWEDVRTRTATSPFARAFFVLAEGLGIVGDGPPPTRPTQGHAQIRVEGQPGVREGRWQAPGRVTPGSADISVHEHDGPSIAG
jgi:predicted nucleotidyltransferase